MYMVIYLCLKMISRFICIKMIHHFILCVCTYVSYRCTWYYTYGVATVSRSVGSMKS